MNSISDAAPDASLPAVTADEREAIWFVLRRNFGKDVQVWVFGSRAEGLNSGDFDLYAECADSVESVLRARARGIEQLEPLLDYRKADLLARRRSDEKTVFEQIAKRNGAPLPDP